MAADGGQELASDSLWELCAAKHGIQPGEVRPCRKVLDCRSSIGGDTPLFSSDSICSLSRRNFLFFQHREFAALEEACLCRKTSLNVAGLIRSDKKFLERL